MDIPLFLQIKAGPGCIHADKNIPFFLLVLCFYWISAWARRHSQACSRSLLTRRNFVWCLNRYRCVTRMRVDPSLQIRKVLISVLSWKKAYTSWGIKPLPPPSLTVRLSAPSIHWATLTQSASKPFSCIIKAETQLSYEMAQVQSVTGSIRAELVSKWCSQLWPAAASAWLL